MPLLDRQRQATRLGAIRIGTKVVSNGKARPAKLDTFRLTSPDQSKIQAAAELYGGEVKPWKPNENAGQQYEVVTTVDRIPVRVPPGNPVEQNYELWTSTRQRLCDGHRERMKGTDCLCPLDLLVRKQSAARGEACKPITRLSLILAELPGLGVWTLSSTGDSAADELAATAELLQRAEERGAFLPATLRLEQREQRGSGELHRFAVPVLDVGASMHQLESGTWVPPQIETTRQALPAPSAKQLPAATVEPLPLPDRATPQAIADLARTATHSDQVRHLRLHARQAGMLEEFVDSSDGVAEPLDNCLYDLYVSLGGEP